ncbi:MAG: cellulase-like family protein [Propionibacteriaceae bacterium]
MTYTPVPIPSHLPQRLTISLWDFSWYVRTGPGEPFEDLDRAFTEAADRGYNTVRICAMPYLLFGSGLDTTAVRLGPLGNGYGQRVRWYDVQEPTVIDGRAQLLALFRAAQRHNCFVILSSWEYQQSSSFADTSAWCEALMRIAPEVRAEAQAVALADLVDFLADHDLDDRIAFTEIHNEVQVGHLADGLPGDPDERLLGLKPRLERALHAFHGRHPHRPATVNYARVPVSAMRAIPETVDVLVTHPYVYGVLEELIDSYGLRGLVEDFDQERVSRDLLRPGAPKLSDWAPDQPWRWDATIVAKPEIYVHDWCDPEAFDRWLYQHYQNWERAMTTTLELWLAVAHDWATGHGVPIVFGEGWIGYTPRDGRFEEGPVGAQFCRIAVDESTRVSAWGTIVCSNAAPQHAMWSDVALQQECNAAFLAGTPTAVAR